MIKVRSNWPVSIALIRKYVDSSMGQRTPDGTYAKDPSLKTALFKAAKKLSLKGTTDPRYLRTTSSLRPFGTVSSSRSATKPYLYSCLAICSWSTLFETMGTPPIFGERNERL